MLELYVVIPMTPTPGICEPAFPTVCTYCVPET